MASAATHDRNGATAMTDQISTGVSNNLVDALSGLVHHMRSLEHSRRRAEQCFADYAAHSIKIILSDSKSDKAGDCNVNSLETKLSSMQHLLNQVEVEKSKANHLFATVDSHLKMIARRTTGAGNIGVSPGVSTGNGFAGNPGTSGAPFIRSMSRHSSNHQNNQAANGQERMNNNVIQPLPQPQMNNGRRPNNAPEMACAYAFTDRGQVNETFCVEKNSSNTAAKYASTNSCPISSQQSEMSAYPSRSKANNKEKLTLASLDQTSPRTLFQMLLTLEDEYDTLERERLDCLALRESAATSRQVTRKLDDRQRELRRQLDRKAIQVDRILKVLEPKLQTQAAKGLGTNEFKARNMQQLKLNLAKNSNKAIQNEHDDMQDGYSTGESAVGGVKSGVEGQGDTFREGFSPMRRTNSEKAGLDGRKWVKRRTYHRRSGEKFNYERYHNVKLLREMKDFNRFLKATGTF